MFRPWSEQEESVAHHEAGHRVMASIVGALPKDVGVRWDHEEKAWKGHVRVQEFEVDSSSFIRISLAGPSAEIKFQAKQSWPEATWDRSNLLANLISCFQDPDTDDSETLNPFRAHRHLMLCSPNGRIAFPFDENSLSDDGASAWDRAQCDKDLIQEHLFYTCDKLDECPAWLAVEALAKALLKGLRGGTAVTIPAGVAEKIVREILCH
jgi:hypothetical protein